MEFIQKQVVIIGAGPSGISAALRLKQAGFKDILLLDRFSRIGGIPGKYSHHGKPTFVRWTKGHVLHGLDYADQLLKKINRAEIETRLETTVLAISPESKEIQAVSAQNGFYGIKAEVILLACGAREKTSVERGRLFGSRPARVYQTLHLLELISRSSGLLPANYCLLGSEVISYSLMEKLEHIGSTPLIIDFEKSATCSIFSRFYFSRKSSTRRIPSVREINIQGQKGLERIHLENNQSESISTDYLILSGNLIPNTELLAAAGIPFKTESRKIQPEALEEQQNHGIFITGNMKGTAFGGERAYFSGYLTAGKIIDYLK